MPSYGCLKYVIYLLVNLANDHVTVNISFIANLLPMDCTFLAIEDKIKNLLYGRTAADFF